ncbi:MAG: shikimate kinase [Coriobacteriales bacterium]|jgi:shikimate kinase
MSGASKSNIVLIGMPASGKSTLGVVLAKIMNLSFADMDLSIQTHMGKTLQQIIDERGASGFLDVENSVLSNMEFSRTVIATGGSAVYSEQAMANLSQTGVVVYLKVGLDELIERIGDLDERGVVFKEGMGEDLEALFEERCPLYEKYADITVDVGGMSIRDAARLVASKVREMYPESF